MDSRRHHKVPVKKDVNKYRDDMEKDKKHCLTIWCRCDTLRGGPRLTGV